MAGILDFLGGGASPQGGILGGAQMPAAPGWANSVGLFGAALADAGANLNGTPGAANNLARFRQMQQQDQLRQAYAQAASATDPDARQQAYATIDGLGGDSSHLQTLAAHRALPQLMQNLQPSMGFNDNPVGVTPAANAAGPGVADARAQALQTNAGPSESMQAPTFAGALQRTDVPELTSQFALPMIQAQMAAQAKAAEPYNLSPGEHRFIGGRDVASVPLKSNPNEPFNQDGTPNKAFQDYQAKLKTAEQAPQWARLDMEKSRYAAGVPNDDTLHDMALRYVTGDKNAAGSLGRNPQAQTAFQNMISQVGREKGLSPQQISQNQQTFQAGTKAVQAFDTGKQGDTTRSLNVFVQHSQLLDQLADAMHNGDYKAINAISNLYKTQTGNPAPTNLSGVAQIYANELQKATLGAPGGEAERQALAAAANPNVAPEVIHGLTAQGRTLAAGQLSGLRQQYKSSTGRDDYDTKLSPETLQALAPPKIATPGGPVKFKGGTAKTGVKFQILGQ